MPNAAGYHVYYQEVQDQTPLNLASSLAIWEDAEAEIRNLLSGRTYRIAVTTFQEDGLESGYSQPIEIAFR